MKCKKSSSDNIAHAILDGIDESMSSYEIWSGGEWLWNAPEYLMTVKISENIIKRVDEKKYITLEDNVDYILDIAGAKGRGKYSNRIRKNGRFDIVIWWENYTPRTIIEVKNDVFGIYRISNDIDRIRDVLKRKEEVSTIESAFMAFYISRHYKSGDAKRKVELQVRKIKKEIDSRYKDLHCSIYIREKDIYNNDMDAWASVVFELRIINKSEWATLSK